MELNTQTKKGNSMNQEIVKETLDSEGNQTHFGKAITVSSSTTTQSHNRNTIITGLVANNEEDYGQQNFIGVMGNNEDGDIRIRSCQTVLIQEENESHIFSSTQNLVISREDAKSLIRQLTSYL